jgi:hypothetical protein
MELWKRHYECLDMNNQQYEKCRTEELKFNQCGFDNLVCSLNAGFGQDNSVV